MAHRFSRSTTNTSAMFGYLPTFCSTQAWACATVGLVTLVPRNLGFNGGYADAAWMRRNDRFDQFEFCGLCGRGIE